MGAPSYDGYVSSSAAGQYKQKGETVMKKSILFLSALLLILCASAALGDTLSTQDGWLYTVERDGTACLRGYSGSQTRLILPAEVDGIPVTSIGQKAFRNNVSIQSVTIPDNYTAIGAYAFENCTRMDKLVLSGSIRTWEEDWGTSAAFRGCVNLFEITFGEGLTYIGGYAFQNCTLLDTVILPESMLKIGKAAFENCELLDIVDLWGDIEASAFCNCAYLSRVTLHNATYIGSDAFRNCTSFKEILLPDTLVSIGSEAFRGCSKLQGISIPSGVTSIAFRAFYDCKQLQSLTLGGSVREWPADWGSCQIFAANPSLTDVTLLPGIEVLPQGAFCDCDSLVSITLPEGLKKIGDNAFESCDSLREVVFSDTVQTIGSCAFRNDTVLSLFTLPRDLISIGNEAFLATAAVEVVIPGQCTDIGYRAFKNCPDLGRVVLGQSLTGWAEDWGDNSAFANCAALNELVIESGVNRIGSYAFQNCVSLQAVEIPASSVEVRKCAFLNCTGLTGAVIYRGEIGESAFENCSALQTVSIRKVTAIGNAAFRNCVELKEMELPRTLLTVGNRAFEGCSAITAVVLPDSLTTLGAYAFRGCVALRSAYIGNNIGTWNKDWDVCAPFDGCTTLEYVFFEALGTSIGNRCFRGCTVLRAVYLPSSILNIPANILENAAPDTVIYGEPGSAAEAFAAEHSLTFLTGAFPYSF